MATRDREPERRARAEAALVSDRKREHLQLALGADVAHATLTTGLDGVHLRARALPGADLDAVDLSSEVFGHRLAAPLLLSCMTGGTGDAGPVNRALAVAAAEHHVALGLGSARALLDDAGLRDSYAVRDLAPDVLLLANLGAAHLGDHGVVGCRRAVEACDANVLVVHLNAVQEAVQPGGDRRFAQIVDRIAATVDALAVPVVVKEVGFGLGPDDVEELRTTGVAGIDVAGAGGTNWARLEGHRDARAGAVAAAFADWGWPTADAVRGARTVLDAAADTSTVLIGSGGLRHGVDALKVLCLGADLAGVGRGLLAAADRGPDACVEAVGVLVDQLRIGAWAVGATRAADLDLTRVRPLSPFVR